MLNVKDGDVIAFIGDSITANGEYVIKIRKYLKAAGRNISIYNCGISGLRATLGATALDEEFLYYKPTRAIINYGANDLGIWLYDSQKKITKELLQKREERIDSYKKGLEGLITKLKGLGIEPILSSPFPMNVDIEEKENITTVMDNKEKEDFIGEGFYTKQTFINIDNAYKILKSKVEELVARYKLQYIDFYTYAKKYFSNECYKEDGTHLTPKGDNVVAKCFLENLLTFNEKISLELNERDKENLQTEREICAYFFVKYNVYMDESDKSSKNILQKLNKTVKEGIVPEGLDNLTINAYKKIANDNNFIKDYYGK